MGQKFWDLLAGQYDNVMSEKTDVITLQTSESYTSCAILTTKEPYSTVGWASYLAHHQFWRWKKRQGKIGNKKKQSCRAQVDCSSAWKCQLPWYYLTWLLASTTPASLKLLSVCQNPSVEIENLQAKLETWNWNPKSQCIHGPKNKFCVQHCGPWFSYDSTQWLKSMVWLRQFVLRAF